MARPAQPVPLARSPLPAAPPAGVVGGWRVGVRESTARLTLADRSPLAKVLVRAAPDGPTAARLGVARGRAARHDGTLVAGTGPGEWLLIAPPGSAAGLAARWDGPPAVPGGGPTPVSAEPSRGAGKAPAGPSGDWELVSAVDLTSGRALLRLTGEHAPDLLATVCAVDLDDRVTPDGSAFRTSVAKVAAEIVRDDTHTRSYLLACDSSYGRYLHGALLDAGAAFGIQATGFPTEATR